MSHELLTAGGVPPRAAAGTAEHINPRLAKLRDPLELSVWWSQTPGEPRESGVTRASQLRPALPPTEPRSPPLKRGLITATLWD